MFLNETGAVSKNDLRLARGIVRTIESAAIARNPASREKVQEDRDTAKDLLRSLTMGTGGFHAEVTTTISIPVAGDRLAHYADLDPDLCVAAPVSVTVQCKPGTCALRFLALALPFPGAADGYIPTKEEAEQIATSPVSRVDPVSDGRALVYFEDPIDSGPIFPVSKEVLSEMLEAQSKAPPLDVKPLSFEDARTLIRARMDEVQTKGGFLDWAGQVPSVADPVVHPEDPARMIRFVSVLMNELRAAGWVPAKFKSHAVWAPPVHAPTSEDEAQATPAA